MRRERLISSCFLFSRPVSIAAPLLTFPKCVLVVLCAIGWRILYALFERDSLYFSLLC
ncbi:hypothetical protein M405DRAFT_803249 [Rhizopogon salebrosus TDB-379]|nr:hypothetical protein M405DRAFT_803249 [Rhizopogon salebrosus TDB-379]